LFKIKEGRMGNSKSASSEDFDRFLLGHEGEKLHRDFRFGDVKIYNSKKDINTLIVVGSHIFTDENSFKKCTE